MVNSLQLRLDISPRLRKRDPILSKKLLRLLLLRQNLRRNLLTSLILISAHLLQMHLIRTIRQSQRSETSPHVCQRRILADTGSSKRLHCAVDNCESHLGNQNFSFSDFLESAFGTEIVDLDVIKKAGIKIAFDPMWGAARGYSDAFLREAGVTVATVHDTRDVLFGGHAPDPDDHLLEDLRHKMRETSAAIGIATDGDADRFGILDEDGTFIQPNYIIALLCDYLVETRGWTNGVGKSVVTTNLINALAEKHKIELYETPVGFKYIGELIKQDKILIGGEESAGLSIRKHVPEKDGVLAGLLCCEMVARRGASLGSQLAQVFAKVGSFYSLRENFHLTPAVKQKFTDKLRLDPSEFHGIKVAQTVRTDGLKLVLADGSWVCYRLSGTEPVVRVYSEARSREDLAKLSAAAKAWIFD